MNTSPPGKATRATASPRWVTLIPLVGRGWPRWGSATLEHVVGLSFHNVRVVNKCENNRWLKNDVGLLALGLKLPLPWGSFVH